MEKLELKIKRWLIFFMVTLFLSGLTAMPVERELSFLLKMSEDHPQVNAWLQRVYDGFHSMNSQYPFLAYGYDWLAFAHFVLAILFIGPYRDPIRNKWVIQFGMIACILIIPFAFTAGHYRGIPLWWRFIDCSFGIIGIIPLFNCLRYIEKLEFLNSTNEQYETTI
jgi:hypothetical protein